MPGQGEPKYDLEERTYQFACRVRQFLKLVPRTPGNFEDGKQLIRSSGSVGANYIEANEFLGRKGFSPAHQDLPEGSQRVTLLVEVA